MSDPAGPRPLVVLVVELVGVVLAHVAKWEQARGRRK